LTGLANVTKRILHIVSSLEPSGTTKQLELFAGGLPQDEFEIQIASLRSDQATEKTLRQRGIETVSVGWRGRIDPCAFRKLWQLIRRLRPDIVHTWNSEANTVGRLAAKMAGSTRMVASERHINPDRSGLERAIDQRLVRWTSCIITNSAAVREFELARGVPAEKFRLLPSGVPECKAESVDRSELLDELGLPHDAKLIAYLGPLVRQKRLKELVWATDQLKAVGVPAHLLLIGDGPQRQALARYRFLNRIDDRVHLRIEGDEVGQRPLGDVQALELHVSGKRLACRGERGKPINGGQRREREATSASIAWASAWTIRARWLGSLSSNSSSTLLR